MLNRYIYSKMFENVCVVQELCYNLMVLKYCFTNFDVKFSVFTRIQNCGHF